MGLVIRACLTVLVVVWATPAAAERVQPVHDPSGSALQAFHKALARTARGIGQTRVLQYGASHTEADLLTGYLRQLLQHKFGDAGHGFIMPARPWRGYRHQDVRIHSSEGWLTDKAYRRGSRQDGLYGLAGFSCSSESSEDFAWVGTSDSSAFGANVSRFDVTYLMQPGGGRFDVRVDGEHYGRYSSHAPALGLGWEPIRVPDGPHELEIRPVGDGEVRLFGVILERTVPGVVVDSLGIRGARASVWLRWDETLFQAQLRRRRPDLVMLAYGTNESGDTRQPITKYESRLATVLERLRRATPEASCVLVGPTDRPITRGRRVVHRERTDLVIAAQRTIGARFGCAFWDASAAMGGPLSIVRWHEATPRLAQKDLIHLTARGYMALGDNLARSLLTGYDGSL